MDSKNNPAKSLIAFAAMLGAGVQHLAHSRLRTPRVSCTDEQLADWQARRAQGTPKKKPGHRNRRKKGRKP